MPGEQPDGAPFCIISGASGTGKSSLALALCQDEDIKRFFDDNLVWLDAGREPTDLPDQINEIGSQLARNWRYTLDIQTSIQQLYRLFEGRKALFVFDDVIDIQQAAQFKASSASIATLSTTRNPRIAPAFHATEVHLDRISDEERQDFIATFNLGDPDNDTQIPLGCLKHPYLLYLAGLCLERKIPVSLGVDSPQSESRHAETAPDASRAYGFQLMDALMNHVPGQYQELMQALVVFPSRTPLSYPFISAFWKTIYDDLTPLEEDYLYEELATLRILTHRFHVNTPVLSDFFVDYVEQCESVDRKALHRRLLDRYPIGDLLAHPGRHDDYIYRFLTYHLTEANQTTQLIHLLFNVDWMTTKLMVTDPVALKEDYATEHANKTLRIIEEAIRLSIPVLDIDREQLALQLIGRLQHIDIPSINQLIEDLRARKASESVWLDPATVDLKAPSNVLIKSLAAHRETVYSLDIDADGVHAASTSADHSVRVWDLRSGAVKHDFSNNDTSYQFIRFTPDGRNVVAVSDRGSFSIWDVQEGQWLRGFSFSDTQVLSISVLHDNRTVLFSDDAGAIHLAELWSGEHLRTWPTELNQVWSVACTTDQELAFAAGDSAVIYALRLEDGSVMQTLMGHDDWVWGLQVTQDGRYLVSGSEDQTLIVWDLKTGNVQQVLKGHRAGVRYFALAHDDTVIVSADEEQSIIVWDLLSGRIMRSFTGLTTWMHDLSVLPNGRGALIASEDPELKLWSLTDHLYHREHDSHVRGIRAMVVSPDNLFVLTASDDASLKKWHIASGRLEQVFEGHADWISDLGISENGRQAISASFDRSLAAWDMESGKCLYTLEEHTDWVWCMALSWNNRVVVSGSEDRLIKIWDMNSGLPLNTLEGHQAGVTHVRVSVDNRFIISASLDHTIRIWNVHDGELVRTLKGHSNTIRQILISPIDQRIISASDDGTIRIWNFELSSRRHRLIKVGKPVKHIALIQNGLGLATVTDDRVLRVWNLTSTESRYRLEGHAEEISDLSISRDGKWAATAGQDRLLCLWDLEHGHLADTFYADYPLTCCTISDHHRRVICGDAAGGLHFLKIRGDVLDFVL